MKVAKPETTYFGAGPDGTMLIQLRHPDWPDVTVLVRPDAVEANRAARDLAREIIAMREEREELEQTVKRLQARIGILDSATGPRPFGPVHARQATDGSVWLLNRNERGWASSGYRYESWAEVAEHWPHLRAAGCGSDEYGPYLVMQDVRGWKK